MKILRRLTDLIETSLTMRIVTGGIVGVIITALIVWLLPSYTPKSVANETMTNEARLSIDGSNRIIINPK